MQPYLWRVVRLGKFKNSPPRTLTVWLCRLHPEQPWAVSHTLQSTYVFLTLFAAQCAGVRNRCEEQREKRSCARSSGSGSKVIVPAGGVGAEPQLFIHRWVLPARKPAGSQGEAGQRDGPKQHKEQPFLENLFRVESFVWRKRTPDHCFLKISLCTGRAAAFETWGQ